MLPDTRMKQRVVLEETASTLNIAVFEASYVLRSVREVQDSVPVFFHVLGFSHIDVPVCVNNSNSAFEFPLHPFSFDNFSCRKHQPPLSVEALVLKLSRVNRIIEEMEDSICFVTVQILASSILLWVLEDRSVVVSYFAITVQLIVNHSAEDTCLRQEDLL